MKQKTLSLIAATLVIASVILCFTSCRLFGDNSNNGSNDVIFDTSDPSDKIAVSVLNGFVFLNANELNCNNIEDRIAMLLMRLKRSEVYSISGEIEKYDKLAYCYLAHDENGNYFFTENMDSSNPLHLQLGLQDLTGLEGRISRDLLSVGYIENMIYSTTANKTVDDGDIISLTYLSRNAGEIEGEAVFHEYYTVDVENDELSRYLVGMREGEYSPYIIQVKKEENGVAVTKEYASVKIEHFIEDKSLKRVDEGDYILTSYTLSFDAMQYYNAGSGSYDLPACFPSEYGYKIVDGQCIVEVKNDLAQVNSTEVYCGVMNPTAYMINFEPGDTTHTITAFNSLIGNFTLSNVKVHSIVTSTENDPYTFTDTLYPSDKYQDPVIVKNTYGKEIDIRDTNLTYCIFPVGYLEAEELSVENIFINFYESSTATETCSSQEDPVYSFVSLNDKSFICTLENDDTGKSAAQIAEELKTLCAEYEMIFTRLSTALRNLKTAQLTYASIYDDVTSSLFLVELETAKKAYMDVFMEKEILYFNILTKIASFEACENSDGESIVPLFIDNCRTLIEAGGTKIIYESPVLGHPITD